MKGLMNECHFRGEVVKVIKSPENGEYQKIELSVKGKNGKRNTIRVSIPMDVYDEPIVTGNKIEAEGYLKCYLCEIDNVKHFYYVCMAEKVTLAGRFSEDLNEVCIEGVLAKDPRTRTASCGVVTDFIIKWKNPEGRDQNFSISTFGKAAEYAYRKLSKDKQVAVFGRLHSKDSINPKSGKINRRYEISAYRMIEED